MDDQCCNVLIRTYAGLDLPPTLSVPAPTSTTLYELYCRVGERMQQSRVRNMLQRQSEDRDVVVALGPRFNLALPTRQRLPTRPSAVRIYDLLPHSKRVKTSPTLNLEMKAPMGADAAADLHYPANPPSPPYPSPYPSGRPSLSSTPQTPVQPFAPYGEPVINILTNTFGGLAQDGTFASSNTLCLNLTASTPISRMSEAIRSRLYVGPEWFHSSAGRSHLCILTLDSTTVNPHSNAPISTLLPVASGQYSPNLLTLQISATMLGGKGGFGSQLRAAGGRMSSRKNRNQTAEQQNASNRNLDGRRIRTITEAKNLAAYLAMKPEMDKKEREERRKRWEAVVEAAERKEEEIKQGKGGNARLDGEWVEQKEDAESKTRNAVLAAMKAGLIGNDVSAFERTGSESSGDDNQDGDSDDLVDGEAGASSASSAGEDDKATTSKPVPAAAAQAPRTFFGWDDEDEDMSEDEDDDAEEDEVAPVPYEGKGKGRAV